MHIVIDGYNLIYTPGQGARRLLGAPDDRLGEQLISLLAAYREANSSKSQSPGAPRARRGAETKRPPARITVVFDGHPQGRPYPVSEEHLSIEVVYSGAGHEADETIKEMVRQSDHRRDMLIVTSDNNLQNICHKLGAPVIDSASFRTELLQELRRHREAEPQEPLVKEEGVPESEVDAWLRDLGLTDEPPHPQG